MPTVAEYLKFANLQMAAESLYGYNAYKDAATLVPGDKPTTDSLTVGMLTDGNLHASKFTPTQAAAFADPNTGWKVVEHISNTTTGFSGTLFQSNANPNELVLSFRSTEFIDDAARDNEATNKLEIKDKGFAFGQIADMEAWYTHLQTLVDDQGNYILAGKQLSLTGYSLSGQLTTAFNLMHGGETVGGQPLVKQVINFNGAGLGTIGDGSLATMQSQMPQMIEYFSDLRTQADAYGLESVLLSERGKTAYRALKAAMVPVDGKLPDTDTGLLTILAGMQQDHPQLDPSEMYDYALLKNAIQAAVQVTAKAHTVATIPSGASAGSTVPPNPADIPDIAPDGSFAIAGESLDYQIAVFLTQQQFNTKPLSIADGAKAALGNPFPAQGAPLSNQWDVAATETTSSPWYMVAYSQFRYGQDVKIFIEDQPFARGNAVSEFSSNIAAGRIELLYDNYVSNDFGDTHSLVLIVDSLSVQNALLQLLPENQRAAAGNTIQTIFMEASWRKQQMNSDQGQAEGDVLESVINALADLVLGPQLAANHLQGSPDGNTWADVTNNNGYTGRETFYQKLDAIADAISNKNLAGQFTLAAAGGSLKTRAREDFFAYAALHSLSPFVLKPTAGANGDSLASALGSAWGETYTAWSQDKTDLAAGKPLDSLNVSETWLIDRTSFLNRKNWFNEQNKNPVNASPNSAMPISYETDSTYFEDVATGYKIAQGYDAAAPFANIHRYYFADNSGKTFAGGGVEDHLYGGAGGDTLKGLGGNDWIEGGSGDDTIEGGSGNDTLRGGLGLDTYILNSNDGWDTLVDTDGLGRITYDGIQLSGGEKLQDNVWQQTVGDQTFHYILTDWTDNGETFKRLTLAGTAGGVFINRWQAGNLGITLPGALTPPIEYVPATPIVETKTTGWYNQDHQVIDARGLLDMEISAVGDYGEVWGSGRLLGNASDNYLHNGDGNDELYGYGGRDVLIATAGNDKLYGGEGEDALQGGADDDLLMGEGGDDVLAGGLGQDVLDGGDGNDYLNGASGLEALRHDWNVVKQPNLWTFNGFGGLGQMAGDGADVLSGGIGNDRLIGGEGDDTYILKVGDGGTAAGGAVEKFDVGGQTLTQTQFVGRRRKSPRTPFRAVHDRRESPWDWRDGDHPQYADNKAQWRMAA